MGASLGVLAASIFVPAVRPFSDLAQGGIGVLFLKFGRDDEIQADALGAEYAAGGGWDPNEVPAFLTTLARISEAADRNGVPNWMATHPQPENRAVKVGDVVKKVLAATDQNLPSIAIRISRVSMASSSATIPKTALSGAISSASGAAVRDRISRRLGNHQQRRAGGRAGTGEQGLHGAGTIEPRPGRSLDQIAQQHMRDSGYKTADITSISISGLQAVIGTYQGNAWGSAR